MHKKQFKMNWKNGVEKFLSEKLKRKITINSNSFVGGGSINETHLIHTTAGNYFINFSQKK